MNSPTSIFETHHNPGLPGESEGDLMMRVNSNATIREMLTASALSGVLDGVLAISYLLLLLFANAAMGLISLSLALLQAAVFLVSYRRFQELMAQDLQTQAGEPDPGDLLK